MPKNSDNVREYVKSNSKKYLLAYVILIITLIFLRIYNINKKYNQNDFSFTVNRCEDVANDGKLEWDDVSTRSRLFIHSTISLDPSQEPVLATYSLDGDLLSIHYVIPDCTKCWSPNKNCIRQLTAVIEGLEVKNYNLNINYSKPNFIETLIWKQKCKIDGRPCDF